MIIPLLTVGKGTLFENLQENSQDSCERSECQKRSIPAGIYLLKVNNRNTRIRCELSTAVLQLRRDGQQVMWGKSLKTWIIKKPVCIYLQNLYQ